MDTGGIEDPTGAAGAIADGNTIVRGHRLGLKPADLIVTGPTGPNVMDVALVMVGERRLAHRSP